MKGEWGAAGCTANPVNKIPCKKENVQFAQVSAEAAGSGLTVRITNEYEKSRKPSEATSHVLVF